MKAFWRRIVDEFRFRKQREVTKFDVPGLMEDVLKMHYEELRSAVKSGFSSCGIFPWNPDAIKYNLKCKYGEKVWWSMKDKEFEREVDTFSRSTASESESTNAVISENLSHSSAPVHNDEAIHDHRSLHTYNLESAVGYYPSEHVEGE